MKYYEEIIWQICECIEHKEWINITSYNMHTDEEGLHLNPIHIILQSKN